jgi:hypothetical protein
MTKRKPLVVQRKYNDQKNSVLLTAFVWSLYCLCTTYGFRLAFVWSLYCLCTTYGFRLVIILFLHYLRFRLVIVLSLYYLWLSFGHYIVSVLLTALVYSLCCLCTTYSFPLVIALSLFYLRQTIQ